SAGPPGGPPRAAVAHRRSNGFRRDSQGCPLRRDGEDGRHSRPYGEGTVQVSTTASPPSGESSQDPSAAGSRSVCPKPIGYDWPPCDTEADPPRPTSAVNRAPSASPTGEGPVSRRRSREK